MRKIYRQRKGKGQGQPQKTVALVNKVVNSKLNKYLETRSALNYEGHFIFQDNVLVQNLNYFMAQGDTGEEYQGRKINIRNMHLKGFFTVENPGGNLNGSILRYGIIKTKKPLTNGSTNITPTDIFRSGGGTSQWGPTGHIDLRKVSLLYDRTEKVLPIPQNQLLDTLVPFDIKVSLKDKVHSWDEDSSGYFKGGNYYMFMCCFKHNATSAVDRTALVNLTWSVNFKDA